jgi:hypothetical protein
VSDQERAPGRGIVAFGWVANALFLVTAVPSAVSGDETVEAVAIATAVALFFVAIGTFVYAFALAVARTTRGDDVAVANLFFLQGSAPRAVQRDFLALFVVCAAIAAATAAWQPFGVLVPMLPVGLAGIWAARYGRFPPRPPTPSRRRV